MARASKILTILAILLLAIGGGGFWIYQSVTTAQKELNSIVEPMIKDMAASKWDGTIIKKYASPKMQAWMVTNNLTNGMPGLGVLGNVKVYDGIESFNMSSGYAALVAKVQFDSGNAVIRLQLCNCDGKWQLEDMSINSPVLTQAIMGSRNDK